MAKYILDTNICIEFLRGNMVVANRILDAGYNNCCVSVITAYELMFGAFRSKQPDVERLKVNSFLRHFQPIPLPAQPEYFAHAKAYLWSIGKKVDDFDTLIAATALYCDYVLVTDNVRHFENVLGLQIENWVR